MRETTTAPGAQPATSSEARPAARPAGRRARRTAVGWAGGLAAVLVLSGCSVAGTDFQPGTAARVGDDSVSRSEVDRLASGVCEAFGPRFADNNQVIALGVVRSSVAQALALSSAARQLGEEYGVEPGAQYSREVRAAELNAGDLPQEQVDGIVLLNTTGALLEGIAGGIGVQLARDGAGSEALSPASTEAVQLGQAELERWLETHEIDIDPVYGIELTSSGAQAADTSTSYAVSGAATTADLLRGDTSQLPPDQQQQLQARTMELPSTQRCGRYGGPTGGLGGLG